MLFGLIGLAAVLHATWNALLKGSADPLRLAARALGVTTLVGVPPAVVIWVAAGRPGLPLEAWELAALSAVVELVYFNFLSAAYRRGELSAVYPIARGTAPVVAVANFDASVMRVPRIMLVDASNRIAAERLVCGTLSVATGLRAIAASAGLRRMGR